MVAIIVKTAWQLFVDILAKQHGFECFKPDQVVKLCKAFKLDASTLAVFPKVNNNAMTYSSSTPTTTTPTTTTTNNNNNNDSNNNNNRDNASTTTTTDDNNKDNTNTTTNKNDNNKDDDNPAPTNNNNNNNNNNAKSTSDNPTSDNPTSRTSTTSMPLPLHHKHSNNNDQHQHQHQHSGESVRQLLITRLGELWQRNKLIPALALQFLFKLKSEDILDPQKAFVALQNASSAKAIRMYVGNASDTRRDFVESCISRHKLNMALDFAEEWNLIASFPDLRHNTTQERLRRIVRHKNGHLAATMCGNRSVHHIAILEELVATGQIKTGGEVQRVFLALTPDSPAKDFVVPEISDDQMDVYLAFGLPISSILFINTESSLTKFSADIDALIASAATKTEWNSREAVGLDLEWKPTGSSRQSPASIMQISTRSTVYILDLIVLAHTKTTVEILQLCLSRFFAAKDIIKLGIGFKTDLKIVANSYPHLNCFKRCTSYLGGEYLMALSSSSNGKATKKQQIGLSRVTQSILGKGLDKSCQCSNWEARPLTRDQLLYAANDAHCIVRCYDAVFAKSVDLKYAAASLTDIIRNHKGSHEVSVSTSVIAAPQEIEPDSEHQLLPLGADDVANAIKEALASQQNNTHGTEALDKDVILGNSANLELHRYAVIGGKTLGMFSNSGPFVCILHKDAKVDYRRLRSLGWKKPKLADREKCSARFGYPCGSMPPVGHRYKLTTYIDSDFLALATSSSPSPSPITSATHTQTQPNDPSTTESSSITTQSSTTTTPTTTGTTATTTATTAASTAVLSTSSDSKQDRKQTRFVLGGGAFDTIVALTKPQLDRLIEFYDIKVAPISEPSTKLHTFSLGSALAERKEMKFMVTMDCKRLARWLRVVGVNASLSEFSSDVEFREVFEEAEREGRIILTCDKKLAARRDAIACFLLNSYDIQQQFKHVTQHFGIEWDSGRFLSICSKCNYRGFHGPLAIEEVEQRNPVAASEIGLKIRNNTTEFWVCKNTDCRQVYWVGPKYRDADVRFKALFEGLDETEGGD